MNGGSLIPNPMHVFGIELPETNELVFENSFYIEDDTKQNFKTITDLRKEVVVASTRLFTDAAIKGVRRYLPYLHGLIESADRFPPDFIRHFQLSWSSALANGKYNTTKIKLRANFFFEVVQVMSVYGLLHRKSAVEKISEFSDDNFDEQCKAPLLLLRQAAGIFIRTSEIVSTKFVVDFRSVPIPETNSLSFVLLANMCVAEGQEIIVRKAISKNTSPTVIAKLCAGIYNMFDNCVHSVDSIEESAKKKGNFLKKSLGKYVKLSRNLYGAMAYRYMGLHCFQIGNPGEAVAYLRRAVELINEEAVDNVSCNVVQYITDIDG
eukprot:TRINITY_DN1979_c0_g1_i1.p1 TRINITY_DN1979_c0_g1~~TRINITY_DN1979_c0_g1_i1.p1  ORF type:complete len:330 (+),score=64.11 TRINITY_DN1979_c0_g1_i1:27-992(+)